MFSSLTHPKKDNKSASNKKKRYKSTLFYLLSLKTVLTKECGRYFVPLSIIIKNTISAHICERNAVMGSPHAMYCIHYHYLQRFFVSRPDSLPVHLTPVVGWTSQIREVLLCN